MTLIDDRIEVYAGLNDTGGVVEFFASPDDFENRDPATVSIGLIMAIPTDYEEIYNVQCNAENFDTGQCVKPIGHTGSHVDDCGEIIK